MADLDIALERMRLPRWLGESRLIRNGGITAVRGLVPPPLLKALVSDARSLAPSSLRSSFAGPNLEDWRGGEPSRALAGISAGPVQFEIFGSETMGQAVSEICGFRVRCAGAGSYSWYVDSGDHLGIHRDIVRCDVALITCLERAGVDSTRDGILCVYPEYAWRPLRDVRSDARVAVPLEPGDTAVLAGGIVPHEVTAMEPGQSRIVSVICFQLERP